jgi:hypothetical protein
MAAITQGIPLEEIREQASDVRVGRAIATAFAAVFIALGWAAGATIYVVKFAALSVRYGYRQGARIRRGPAEPQRPVHGDGLNKV